MDRDELKKIAEIIVKAECVIEQTEDEEKKRQAMDLIENAIAKVSSFEDMFAIDAIVQNILSKTLT